MNEISISDFLRNQHNLNDELKARIAYGFTGIYDEDEAERI